jgi:hypothetical protein
VNHNSTRHDARETSSLLHAAHVVLPVAACYALVALPAWWFHGSIGVAAAGIAALICAIASGAAAVAASRLSAGGQPIAATLLAMLFRMALPLALGVIAAWQRGPLVDAGIMLYLVGFYMVALAADSWHAIGRLRSVVPGPRES